MASDFHEVRFPLDVSTLALPGPLDPVLYALQEPGIESLDDALRSLERIDERAHRVVEMRYFGGMEIEEIAEHLAISAATVKRDWQKARAYLLHVLTPGEATP